RRHLKAPPKVRVIEEAPPLPAATLTRQGAGRRRGRRRGGGGPGGLMPTAGTRGPGRPGGGGPCGGGWRGGNPSEVRRAYEEALAGWGSEALWDDPGALAKARSPLDAAAGAARGRVVLRGHAGDDIPDAPDEAWLASVTKGCDKAAADEVRALV